jgi:phosphatidylglycerophosphatase A
MKEIRLLYSREEMLNINKQTLKERGVSIEDIAIIAYKQQSKYTPGVSMDDCIESVEKILSLRDTFHILQLGVEIDRLCEEGLFKGPIQDIIRYDLGVFGVDEVFGLDIARLYGVIGQTNFGDIDVNKPGIVDKLNQDGKDINGMCHTFMDGIVGSIAAAASTRVAQIITENKAGVKR